METDGGYLGDGGVVEVDPQLELGVEEEGGIVLAVVGHHAHQPMRRHLLAIDVVKKNSLCFRPTEVAKRVGPNEPVACWSRAQSKSSTIN